MKIIDTIILIVTIWSACRGLKKGLFDEVFAILAILAGGWGAVYGSEWLMNLLGLSQTISGVIAMVVSFVICAGVVMLIGKLCKTAFNIVLSKGIEKILGLVLGGLKVIFLAGLLFLLINSVDKNNKIFTPERQSQSLCYKPCTKTAQFLIPRLKNFQLSMMQTMENLETDK